MIRAEIMSSKKGKWIKITFRSNVTLMRKMQKLSYAKYNPSFRCWAIPYEYRMSFEDALGDHLVIWENDEDVTAGGINEKRVPNTPVIPGYSVTYDKDNHIIAATGFKTKPWAEFQVRGFNLIATRSFLILADDCGLGKTYQVVTAMEARKKQGNLKRGVVICKASLLFNWRDEVYKHTDCKAIVYSGSKAQRANILEELKNNNDWTFVIVSYETFRTDNDLFVELDNAKSLDFCVCDEAHKAKNPNSQIGKSLHTIPFKYRYILTATPLPNSPLEAYNYLKFGHKINMNWWAFQKRYVVFGGLMNKEIIMYQNIKELRKLIQDNMLRRLKKDKLKELPDIVFKEITIEMTAKQKTLYNAIKKEVEEDLKDTDLKSIPNTLTKLLRLQQVTDSPVLVGNDSESSKLGALDDLLDELIVEGGEKVIVFSRFKGMVEYMQEKYKQFNPAVIHGGVDSNGKSETSAIKAVKNSIGSDNFNNLDENKKRSLIESEMSSERQREVYKFQQDDTCKLFIGCSPACREGLTLTAATHVIFLDCEWSPAYVEQSYSRAHRIGQKNAVTVYYLLCKDTIDEYVMSILKRKEAIAQSMLDGEAIPGIKTKELIYELIGEKAN